MFLRLAALATALLLTSQARAEWHRASSDHFVIYADDDAEDIRAFAAKLERFHSAMEVFTGRTIAKPSPSNRITVFVAGSANDVRKLAGGAKVEGFYIPRAAGSLAVVQDIRAGQGNADLSTTILLHEYAHHFLISINRFAMPVWMNEGAAEFFAAARFGEDGAVYLGLSSKHRFYEILRAQKDLMRVREMLEFDGAPNERGSRHQAFYGRSWLLYHYLSTNDGRKGQLREYWLEVLRGTPSSEAGEKVFGSLSVLERELDLHWRNGVSDYITITAEELSVGEVTLRPLSEGEAAMMQVTMRSQRGTGKNEAIPLAAEAREIAAGYPDDPNVLATLAKIENDAGEIGRAVAAADRAIAIDANQIDAYVQKGLALFRKARVTRGDAAQTSAYEQAMAPFRQIKALETHHILPPIYTYRSFVERDLEPTEAAKEGLVRAAKMAPFDQELWLIVGMTHMNDGRIADATAALRPIASNPHGSKKSDQVRSMLSFLASKKEGEVVPVREAISNYFKTE